MRTVVPIHLTILSFIISGVLSQDPELPSLVIEYPTCNGCYCIPDEIDGGKKCPKDNPASHFSGVSTNEALRFSSQVAVNEFELNCNPFTEEWCQTQPPQKLVELGDEAVCGIQYKHSRSVCPTQYKLVSYASWEEAEEAGAIVTHVGACGVCSTTKDLAVFMSTRDFTSLLTKCISSFFLGGLSPDSIVECIEEIGFSQACSRLQFNSARHIAEDCVDACEETLEAQEDLQVLNDKNFQCPLSACAECQSNGKAALHARQISGRDHYRSGILNQWVTPCSELVDITHNSCPQFNQMEHPPTFSDAPSPTRIGDDDEDTATSDTNSKLLAQTSGIASLLFLINFLVYV